MLNLLEINQLCKRFGGLQVVNNLSFEINQGEILSLIGPNGAGKSTVLNLISGLTPSDSGQIRFEGRSIVGLPPHRLAGLGIARTFQTLRLFLNMSVIENVMAAAQPRTKSGLLSIMLRLPGWRREEAHIRAVAEETLAFFGERLIGYRLEQPAYNLSYANRRRLEIARAMATRPKLLLLDEPAAGMNPHETKELTRLIGRLRAERGYTILLIEHDMSVIGSISDRVIALDHGRQIASGRYDEVVSNERVIEAYLGQKREHWSKEVQN